MSSRMISIINIIMQSCRSIFLEYVFTVERNTDLQRECSITRAYTFAFWNGIGLVPLRSDVKQGSSIIRRMTGHSSKTLLLTGRWQHFHDTSAPAPVCPRWPTYHRRWHSTMFFGAGDAGQYGWLFALRHGALASDKPLNWEGQLMVENPIVWDFGNRGNRGVWRLHWLQQRSSGASWGRTESP
jgi:hypothetical protein